MICSKPTGIFIGAVVLAIAVGCAHKQAQEPNVDAKWVEEVSRRHNHEVLKCYEDALKQDRSLQGMLTLELDTDQNGAAQNVRVRQGVSEVLNACVVSRAKSWSYPWIKKETLSIQENYKLYLRNQQPYSEFSGPGMDREQIKAIVQANWEDVEACYERVLRRKPSTRGTLTLEWYILGSGEVTQVAVIQPLEPALDKCVVERVSKWKFPHPPNYMSARVSYPFEFSSNRR